jgi:nucleoside-diphosphate-sugar epimerase
MYTPLHARGHLSPQPALAGARVLVVGAGWLGAEVAREAVALGMEVVTLQRTARAPVAGSTAVVGDVGTATSTPEVMSALPGTVEHVVLAIAPSASRGDDYAAYPRGTARVVALAARLGARTLLYTSSTGVYGRLDGGVVRETDPLPPADGRVGWLREAEAHVLAAGDSGVVPSAHVLRVAGLYGPERDPARRLVAGDPDDPRWMNLAWRGDVVTAVLGRLAGGRLGAHRWNCSDGVPVQVGAVVRALRGEPAAVTLPGWQEGAHGGETNVVAAAGRDGRGNQRVSAAALVADGWTPSLPTVYHGLQALGHAVGLPTEPLPRP